MSTEIISRDRVDELMREVFREIQAMGGKARPKELFSRLTPRLHLSPHEKETTASGRVRWETLIRWYTVDCSKVGYLEKSGGYWNLTPQGEEALTLQPGELVRTAQRSPSQSPEPASSRMRPARTRRTKSSSARSTARD